MSFLLNSAWHITYYLPVTVSLIKKLCLYSAFAELIPYLTNAIVMNAKLECEKLDIEKTQRQI